MKAEYIDHMGDDLAVVNAARVSFDKETDWTLGCCGNGSINGCCGDPVPVLTGKDHRLLIYLATHNHWTPFAHTSIKLRMKAPVPIRTQCFKHKSGFVENEESRRYISSRPELFVPEVFRKAPDGSIKQGSGEAHSLSLFWRETYRTEATRCINLYERMIEDGVCPEQARLVLPQGVQVNWIWTGSLAAYARFYGLRKDAHAQKEVQELAQAVGEIIEPLFPVSWSALTVQ